MIHRSTLALLFVFGPSVLFAVNAAADTTIVVNLGVYASAAAAGGDEANVDWLDADRRDDAICTECFAAVELQKHLRMMTGRANNFAIADDDKVPEGELIVVGSPATNAAAARFAPQLGVSAEEIERLGPEGYRIKTGEIDGRRVTLISGGGRVGTLYGVYDLLHRQGCRWFSPAEFDAHVPFENGDRHLKHQGASPRFQWNPSFDVAERPSFSLRGFHATEKRETPEFILWMARNRLNFWTVHVNDQALLRKLGIKMSCGGHLLQWMFMHPDAPYPYDHPNFADDQGNPKDPYPLSDDYRGDANGDRKLSYFEAHPEWYPLIGGRRIPGAERLQSRSANFCTSNADAVAEFSRNIIQALGEGSYRGHDEAGDAYGIKGHMEAIEEGIYRGADVINLWMLDVGKWCECPKCKALGTPTDRNLLVVHHFDRAVKRARREGRLARPIKILFLAYSDVVDPPSRPLPEDFDYETCTATFFPIGRCYVHKFDDPSCEFNAPYHRQLAGWMTDPARHYRGRVIIGEYYNVSRFECLPGCFMHVMAHDIPYYHRLGTRQFHYMHVTTGRWGSKSLTNYQMARRLWDVDTDCEALWADYFARRYGPAADTMRRFYGSLEKMLCNLEALKARLRPRFTYSLDRGIKPLFPNSHLQYRREPGVESKGPTLGEMVAHGETCRKLIDGAMAIVAQRGQSHFRGGEDNMPGNAVSAAKIGTVPFDRIRARLAEDELVFTYAERTLRYYDQCVKAYQLAWAGQEEQARRHYEEARRVADLLRKDTWSVGLTFQRGKRTHNAFDATHATRALDRLAELLDSPD